MVLARSLVVALVALVAGVTSASAGPGLTPEAKKAMRDASNPVVLLSTTLGDISIELYKKEAPKPSTTFSLTRRRSTTTAPSSTASSATS